MKLELLLAAVVMAVAVPIALGADESVAPFENEVVPAFASLPDDMFRLRTDAALIGGPHSTGGKHGTGGKHDTGGPTAPGIESEIHARVDPRAAPEDPGPDADAEDKWTFRLTPFFWVANIDVRSTVNGTSTETTIHFDDILDNLNLAVMVAGEARKGDWAILATVDYLHLENDLKRIPGDLELQSAFVEAAIAHRFYVAELGELIPDAGPSTLSFEGILGWRYYYVDVDFDPRNLPGGSESVDWLDLVVGARLILELTGDVRAGVRSEWGGFNIGESDGSYHLIAVAEYDLTERWSLDAGFRYLSVGYEKDSDNDINMRMQGAILGATYHF